MDNCGEAFIYSTHRKTISLLILYHIIIIYKQSSVPEVVAGKIETGTPQSAMVWYVVCRCLSVTMLSSELSHGAGAESRLAPCFVATCLKKAMPNDFQTF
jgi:hypothetical protein